MVAELPVPGPGLAVVVGCGARVANETIGARILDAMERAGLTKAELGRRTGKPWRTVHAWTQDEQRPDAEGLAALAEVLPVTAGELLGVGVGVAHDQDPPFEAWAAFLRTPEGAATTAAERRALRSVDWPTQAAPTVGAYMTILAGVRMAARR